MERNKYLEYYLDSRIYSSEEVQQSIEKTKKEFPNKKVKVTLSLNDFGMYIITFKFENKNTYFNKIKISLWNRFRKPLLLGNGSDKRKTEKKYGQYKETRTYRPY